MPAPSPDIPGMTSAPPGILYVMTRRTLFTAPLWALAADPPSPWQRLLEGNARFASSRAAHPDQDPALRMKLSSSQHPFATILTCSDSRVAPELIFDQGLGDLFVIRVAGNIVDDAVLASIEYAVRHLQSSFIVVLGHQRCGAVQAALSDAPPEGHLPTLIDAIRPSVEAARRIVGGDLLDLAVRENARRMGALIRRELGPSAPPIIAARYDLVSGRVAPLP